MQSSSSQCSSKNIVVSEKIKVSSQNFKSVSSAICVRKLSASVMLDLKT